MDSCNRYAKVKLRNNTSSYIKMKEYVQSVNYILLYMLFCLKSKFRTLIVWYAYLNLTNYIQTWICVSVTFIWYISWWLTRKNIHKFFSESILKIYFSTCAVRTAVNTLSFITYNQLMPNIYNLFHMLRRQ